MAKLSKQQKLEIYNKRMSGETFKNLSLEYSIRKCNLQYLVRLIDKHGPEVLRDDKNNKYSPEQKLEMINKVLIDGQSILETSIEYGLLGLGLLNNWIKSYKENNCDIVDKKQGRKSTMNKKEKQTKKYEEMTDQEKIKYLEDKNMHLEAEIEYIKKLEAVVLSRKNQLPKKK